MGKLRHLAIASDDPVETARVLRETFDLEEVGTHDSDLAIGVFLSDGTMNIAVLKFRTDQIGKGLDYTGPHHFGFFVDDVDSTKQKLLDAGSVLLFDKPENSEGKFFEVKMRLPGDIVIDIADHLWTGAQV